MAEMKFLGMKEVLLSTFNALSTEEKVGYIWFVKKDQLAESEGDIYLGARHYGHFGKEAQDIDEIKGELSALTQNVEGLSAETEIIEDKLDETISGLTEVQDAVEELQANQVKAGDYVTVSGGTVSVKISADEGNQITAGTDGGLFSALYYECLDEDDLNATI